MSENNEDNRAAAMRAKIVRQIAEREQYESYLAEKNAWTKRHRIISDLKKATGAS